jgi:hypothetical protein
MHHLKEAVIDGVKFVLVKEEVINRVAVATTLLSYSLHQGTTVGDVKKRLAELSEAVEELEQS